MKNIYQTIFLLILNSAFSIQHSAFSQTAPAIDWQNTIGGSSGDFLSSIKQTSDGGYILGGFSYSNISGDKTENCFGQNDYWIVKTDATGTIQWENTIGANWTDELWSVDQTTDGGYILGGDSDSDISGDKTENSIGSCDYWIIKADASGTIQWQNTIGGTGCDMLRSVQQTSDGGYMLAGFSNSGISGDKTESSMDYDYWLVKTDASGTIQWQNTIGGSGVEWLHSAQQTNDGGYILAGRSDSNISGDKTENCIGSWDYWIVKTDATGNVQWENTIGGDDWDIVNSVRITTDGGYILAGETSSNISGDKTENCIGLADFWLVKINSSGIIQWQNTIGGNYGDIPYSVQQTSDGGFIVGGYSESNISGDKTENSIGVDDYWIVKTDSLGNIQWQNTIGGTDIDIVRSLQQTTDGGYILGGYSTSNISGDKTENSIGYDDYWIIKLFPDTITGIIQQPNQTSNIQIYPNPATDKVTVNWEKFDSGLIGLRLFDLFGRRIPLKPSQTISNSTQTTIDVFALSPGVYLLNLTNEKTGERMNGKIVIQ